MKVTVDPGRCQGHNRCHALAPGLFDVDQLGYAAASSSGHISPLDEPAARLAAENCPEHAIRLDPDTPEHL
jgi:ferredoxin